MNWHSRFNPARLVYSIIDGLSPRLKEVIILRFGLKDGRRHTLEAIGQKFGITRERVRQIQNDAFDHLTKGAVIGEIKPLLEALEEHFKHYGWVRKESTLLEADLLSQGTAELSKPEQKAAVYFALHLGNQFERYLESDIYNTFWAAQKSVPNTVKRFSADLVDYLATKKTVLKGNDIKELASKLLIKHGASKNPSEKIINAHLGLVKSVAKNIYGEYGLRSWPEINPVGVKDKAHLVFKKLGRPMHFKEVAQAINQAGFSKRLAHPQTVHNELIKDTRFVLIGRGMYALKEWGYMPGTVKDVLVSILKKSSKSLTKEEVLEHISKQRVVKPNTVALNLQNKNYFKRTSDGRYTLA